MHIAIEGLDGAGKTSAAKVWERFKNKLRRLVYYEFDGKRVSRC